MILNIKWFFLMDNSFESSRSCTSSQRKTWFDISSSENSTEADSSNHEPLDYLEIKDNYYELMEKLRQNEFVSADEIHAFSIKHQKMLRSLDSDVQMAFASLCNLQLLLDFYHGRQLGNEVHDSSVESLNASYEIYYDPLISNLVAKLDQLLIAFGASCLTASEKGDYAYSLNKMYYELDSSLVAVQIDLMPVFNELSIESIIPVDNHPDISSQKNTLDREQKVIQAMQRWIERRLDMQLTSEQINLLNEHIEDVFEIEIPTKVDASTDSPIALSSNPHRFSLGASSQKDTSFSALSDVVPAVFS